MDDDEIEARFGALRTALALAISLGRSPHEMQQLRTALRDVSAYIPEGAHPAVADELERIVATFVRLPTHHDAAPHAPSRAADTSVRHVPVSAARGSLSLSEEATIDDLL